MNQTTTPRSSKETQRSSEGIQRSSEGIQRSPEETAEIEKHKYFLSEQAGHDVGWELAQEDWDSNYAEQFRQSMSPGSTPPPPGETKTFFMRFLAMARKKR